MRVVAILSYNFILNLTADVLATWWVSGIHVVRKLDHKKGYVVWGKRERVV
jgi:hypothetical protein